MKWFLAVGLFLGCAKLSVSSAIRCKPGDKDESCITKSSEKVSKSNLLSGKECSPGTQWTSRCNQCECTAEGYVNCSLNDCPGQENEPLLRCAPDTVWKNDCNTCSCTSYGQAMCTRMGCLGFHITDWNPTPTKKSDTQIVPTNETDIYIVPMNETGTNTIEYDGLYDEETQILQKRTRCEPFTIFQRDCNRCFCSADGEEFACTLNMCQNRQFDESGQNAYTDENNIQTKQNSTSHKINKRAICKPNLKFRIDCNDCTCAPDAQSYSCTAKECDDRSISDDVEVFKVEEGPDHIERHSVCKPSGIFYMGCNTCRCNVDGSNYACTNKPCPLPDDVEIFHELTALKSALNTTKAVICAANRMFIKDCNTCWCNEDGTSYFCTRKSCVNALIDESSEDTENLRTIKQQCRPDEVFEMDCNTCRCNSDGKSFSCTRRACILEDDTKNPVNISDAMELEVFLRPKRSSSQQKSNPAETTPSRLAPIVKETPKSCQPGLEFRMDCNKCLCDNEGQNFSCTRIDCAALNSNGNGGDRTKREVTSQNQTDCTPGSVFEQGCNVCRCTEDGNHATCTMKICNKESSDNDINAPESDPSFRCNPGEQFKRGCNDCTCSADGKSVFCTLRLCDQEINPS